MKVLLLSGGMDSTCGALLLRPDVAVTIDYGQVSADGESHAATQIARALAIPHEILVARAPWSGAGLLAGRTSSPLSDAAEWWPFRNQLLITLAAAWAVNNGGQEIILGSVMGDSDRHVDGGHAFFDAVNVLVTMQEGGLQVRAPFLDITAIELARRSGADISLLAWCHSCHRANIACGQCPGCWKREETFAALGFH